MQKRKTLIVDPKLQISLIAIFFGLPVIPIIGMLLFFRIAINNILASIPQEETSIIELVGMVTILNYLSFGGFIVILIFFCFLITQYLHKIIGPLYRIELVLKDILKTKNYSTRITIREKDFLHSFVDTLNRLLEGVEKK